MLSLPADALESVASWLRLADLASFRATCRRIRSMVGMRSDLGRLERLVQAESTAGLASIVALVSKHLEKRKRDDYFFDQLPQKTRAMADANPPTELACALKSYKPCPEPRNCACGVPSACEREAACRCAHCNKNACLQHAVLRLCGECGEMKGCTACSPDLGLCLRCGKNVCGDCNVTIGRIRTPTPQVVCTGCTRDFCVFGAIW